LLVIDRNRRYSSQDDGFQNDWALGFAQGIPIEFRMLVGSGMSTFEVADLDVRKFQLRVGDGDSKIDLAGSWDHNVDVDIDQGAGDIQVALPQGMPVRVSLSEGSGILDTTQFELFEERYWVNSLYTGSTEDPTVFVNIQQSTGSTSLILVAD